MDLSTPPVISILLSDRLFLFYLTAFSVIPVTVFAVFIISTCIFNFGIALVVQLLYIVLSMSVLATVIGFAAITALIFSVLTHFFVKLSSHTVPFMEQFTAKESIFREKEDATATDTE